MSSPKFRLSAYSLCAMLLTYPQGVTQHRLIGSDAVVPAVLVAAPSGGGAYYGMYCITCTAASFTLSGSYKSTEHNGEISITFRCPRHPRSPKGRPLDSICRLCVLRVCELRVTPRRFESDRIHNRGVFLHWLRN